jgi:hypothetical protein
MTPTAVLAPVLAEPGPQGPLMTGNAATALPQDSWTQ